jgi:hypothetical protein
MPRVVRRKRILWTSKDVKLMKSLAGDKTVAQIARQLKRSAAAVRFKAHTIGLSLRAGR